MNDVCPSMLLGFADLPVLNDMSSPTELHSSSLVSSRRKRQRPVSLDYISTKQPRFSSNQPAPIPTKNDEPVDTGEIRCICSIPDDDGYTIQCELCLVWQHALCVGIHPENEPEHYFCDRCQPRPLDSKKALLLQRRNLLAQATASKVSTNIAETIFTSFTEAQSAINVSELSPRTSSSSIAFSSANEHGLSMSSAQECTLSSENASAEISLILQAHSSSRRQVGGLNLVSCASNRQSKRAATRLLAQANAAQKVSNNFTSFSPINIENTEAPVFLKLHPSYMLEYPENFIESDLLSSKNELYTKLTPSNLFDIVSVIESNTVSCEISLVHPIPTTASSLNSESLIVLCVLPCATPWGMLNALPAFTSTRPGLPAVVPRPQHMFLSVPSRSHLLNSQDQGPPQLYFSCGDIGIPICVANTSFIKDTIVACYPGILKKDNFLHAFSPNSLPINGISSIFLGASNKITEPSRFCRRSCCGNLVPRTFLDRISSTLCVMLVATRDIAVREALTILWTPEDLASLQIIVTQDQDHSFIYECFDCSINSYESCPLYSALHASKVPVFPAICLLTGESFLGLSNNSNENFFALFPKSSETNLPVSCKKQSKSMEITNDNIKLAAPPLPEFVSPFAKAPLNLYLAAARSPPAFQQQNNIFTLKSDLTPALLRRMLNQMDDRGHVAIKKTPYLTEFKSKIMAENSGIELNTSKFLNEKAKIAENQKSLKYAISLVRAAVKAHADSVAGPIIDLMSGAICVKNQLIDYSEAHALQDIIQLDSVTENKSSSGSYMVSTALKIVSASAINLENKQNKKVFSQKFGKRAWLSQYLEEQREANELVDVVSNGGADQQLHPIVRDDNEKVLLNTKIKNKKTDKNGIIRLNEKKQIENTKTNCNLKEQSNLPHNGILKEKCIEEKPKEVFLSGKNDKSLSNNEDGTELRIYKPHVSDSLSLSSDAATASSNLEVDLSAPQLEISEIATTFLANSVLNLPPPAPLCKIGTDIKSKHQKEDFTEIPQEIDSIMAYIRGAPIVENVPIVSLPFHNQYKISPTETQNSVIEEPNKDKSLVNTEKTSDLFDLPINRAISVKSIGAYFVATSQNLPLVNNAGNPPPKRLSLRDYRKKMAERALTYNITPLVIPINSFSSPQDAVSISPVIKENHQEDREESCKLSI